MILYAEFKTHKIKSVLKAKIINNSWKLNSNDRLKLHQLQPGTWRDRTLDDKLMYITNDAKNWYKI